MAQPRAPLLLWSDTISLRRFLARNIGAEQRYRPLFAAEIDHVAVRAPNEPRDGASRPPPDRLEEELRSFNTPSRIDRPIGRSAAARDRPLLGCRASLDVAARFARAARGQSTNGPWNDRRWGNIKAKRTTPAVSAETTAGLLRVTSVIYSLLYITARSRLSDVYERS